MSSPSDSLHTRYGERSPLRRAMLIGFATLVVVAAAGWLVWAMLFHSSPTIASSEIGHDVLDEHRATIKVRIEMDDGIERATCSARAISADKAIVGEQAFTPDPADGPVYELDIKTERRATTVEWIGCKADGQPRYR